MADVSINSFVISLKIFRLDRKALKNILTEKRFSLTSLKKIIRNERNVSKIIYFQGLSAKK